MWRLIQRLYAYASGNSNAGSRGYRSGVNRHFDFGTHPLADVAGQMNLTLQRFASMESGTFSEITADGQHVCFGLEPATPVTPTGDYKVTRYNSPRFGHKVFLINDVPGHSMIEMHSGNTAKDTHGCVILGDSIDTIYGTIGVKNSKLTLERLLSTLPETFTLTIKE